MNFFIGIRDEFKRYNTKISWPVFCSIFCFTIGAWLDINGLWCETVIMVHKLPEGWKLSSILSASTQIAQIGPIIFLIGKRYFPNQFTYQRTIYVILMIGATSCLLLAFFWDYTSHVFGEERSTGLLVLNFFLALLDGTSSVTFLPYIGGNFAKEYMIPNYIGESLAALVPSVLSLAQGLGQTLPCQNITIFNETSNTNTTSLVPGVIKPNFSVQIYFLMMFVLLIISTSSFTFLNLSKTAAQARKQNAISNRVEKRIGPHFEKSENKESICSNSTLVSELSAEGRYIEKPATSTEDHSLRSYTKEEKREMIILLTLVFMLSFGNYGVLPGLQTYSTLPYGNEIFNYAVNLSFVCLPFAILLSIWSYEVSVIRICIEFAIATGFSLYIVILACTSPCPPFMNSFLGPLLSVLSWIMSQSMFMRIRCLIATRLERFGQKCLLILGALTMFGQIFGGLIIFVVVNIYSLLEARPDCTENFCSI